MANHVWTVLCRRALIDQSSNSISLMDVVEGITITQTTGLIPKPSTGIDLSGMDLVTLWIRSEIDKPEAAKVRVILQLPDGRKHIQPEQTIDLKKSPRNRHIVRTAGLPFTDEGRYYWTVQQKHITKSRQGKWKTVAKIPYDLVVIREPEIVQADGPMPKTRKKAKARSKRKTQRRRKA